MPTLGFPSRTLWNFLYPPEVGEIWDQSLKGSLCCRMASHSQTHPSLMPPPLLPGLSKVHSTYEIPSRYSGLILVTTDPHTQP